MRLTVFFAIILVISETIANETMALTDEEYNSMPPLFHVDDYDRCMSLGKKALYCAITVQLKPLGSNNSTIWHIIEKISNNPKNFRHDRLRHMICVPTFCPFLSTNSTLLKNNQRILKERLSECYSQKYTNLDLSGTIAQIQCTTTEPRYAVDEWDIFVAALFGAILLLIAIASFYEGLARYKSKEKYDAITSTRFGSIISCFSIVKNWKRLSGKTTNVDLKPLKCMNGVRSFNIIAVVLSHTYILTFAVPTINPTFLETVTEKPFYMIVLNGTVVIQTYFLIAGWLLSYNFFVLIEKEKSVKIHYVILAFLNRYIRLTPCLALVIAFNTSWLYHLGSGPFWDKMAGDEYRNCRKNWWTNLLYINNYYDFRHTCLLQTWYLGADTQLFLLSLIIMTIIWKFKKYLKTILGVCLAIGFIIPGLINYVYSYDIIVRYYPEPLYRLMLDVVEFRLMYVTAHTNIGGYVVGMIFGYIYYKYKDYNFFTRKSYLVAWWFIVFALPLAIIFAAYPFYQDYFQYSRAGAAIYTAISRNLFAFCIAMGIFGGTQKIGWFLRSCVVWAPFQILGRLTYCVYLVHLSLIRIRVGLGRAPNHITVYYLLLNTLLDLFVAYIFGLFLCLFVEMPTSALQKLMVPQAKIKNFNKEKITNIAVITNDVQVSKM
ncbi:hypothetical protein FQR65_LT00721 [Abscondita terminalis]|nr:hypothetical protein FQR65_LT00721 [Abscondita terminalis]